MVDFQENGDFFHLSCNSIDCNQSLLGSWGLKCKINIFWLVRLCVSSELLCTGLASWSWSHRKAGCCRQSQATVSDTVAQVYKTFRKVSLTPVRLLNRNYILGKLLILFVVQALLSCNCSCSVGHFPFLMHGLPFRDIFLQSTVRLVRWKCANKNHSTTVVVVLWLTLFVFMVYC